MNLKLLEKLMREYLATQDDVDKEETWTTTRGLAAEELAGFINWLYDQRKRGKHMDITFEDLLDQE